jgi:glutathione synthase/RimK-type ligase-like ATP-grasp enzyme
MKETRGPRENRQVPQLFLVTSSGLPEGEPRGELLLAALADRGVDAAWAVWDDPAVDWSAAELVAVRSTWDYHRRLEEFLAWARDVETRTRLLNGAELFAWNADKGYLVDLDLPHVPTARLDDPSGLAALVDRWGTVVVKPRVGASGVGLVLVSDPDDADGLTGGPWVVQPLVQSVRTVGETSVYVFGGRAGSQVDKRPGGDEVRVHEEYGGSSVPAPLDPERAALAERSVAWVGERFGEVPAYARIDVMRWQDMWVVSELELIEPGLYLDVDPAPAEPFAETVLTLLG